MTGETCTEMHLLIQADLDRELTSAEAARVGAHLDGCPACAAAQAELAALSERVRREVPYHKAPDALRAAVRERVAVMGSPADGARADRPAPASPAGWRTRLSRPSVRAGVPFGAGFALAACLALALLPRGSDRGLPEAVVAGHVRALQPGHLMDVASTDQHTVKPWFDGRLDYAPPVKDFRVEGFPLRGGRLDYLAGRPVAALVYGRRQHLIDVFVLPKAEGFEPAQGSRNGYNFSRWNQDGMAFWAVSDLGARELADFVRLWRAS